MRHEPVGERFDVRNFVCFGAMVAFNPALHLTFEETWRMTEGVKPGCLPVDSVNLYQRVDHCVRYLLAEIRRRCHAWWEGGIHNDPFAAFHHVERRSQDGRIIAIDVGFWRKWEDRVDVL